MLYVEKGDITTFEVDAIVNSANPSLLAGGGVCGAIHRVAGPELEKECREIGRVEPGTAVVTGAYNLPATSVIHAVGPRYFDGSRGEDDLLAQTYGSIAQKAVEAGFNSLAIPSISTGIYGFPLQKAAAIAIKCLSEDLPIEIAVTIVCFDETTFSNYKDALKAYQSHMLQFRDGPVD